MARAAAALLLCAVGCTGSGLGQCPDQPDVSGRWSMDWQPLTGGAAATIPRPVTVLAQLTQGQSSNAFGLGFPVSGSLTASDKGFFDTITIPVLKVNNGSKTGAVFGCTLKINVPVASPVTDDDRDQGPLRVALVGNIVARGRLQGDASSSVILVEDQAMAPRRFTWIATQLPTPASGP